MADFDETVSLIKTDKQTKQDGVVNKINKRHAKSTALLKRLSYTQASMVSIAGEDIPPPSPLPRSSRGVAARATKLEKQKSLKALAHDINSMELDGHTKWFAVKAALFGGLGGLHIGYDIGAVAGGILPLTREFGMSTFQQELIASVMLVGAIFGSSFGGYICDTCGRRFAILLTAGLFGFGAIITCTATLLPVFFCGRFVMGIGIAIASIADVAYLTEVAPARWRGGLIGCNELMTTLGILLAYVLGAYLAKTPGGWRVLYGIPVFLALIQFLGMLTMPQSPRWLLSKGMKHEAREALNHVFSNPTTCKMAMMDIEKEVRVAELKAVAGNTDSLCRDYIPELRVSVCLMMFQQLTGNSNVMNYAPVIFKGAGFTDQAANNTTVVLGVVKVFSTVIAILSLEELGRRKLLLAGSAGATVSMLLLAVSFVPKPPVLSLAATGCFAFAASWAMSFGPIGFVIASEMFPTSVRGKAIGVCAYVNWVSNLVVSMTSLSIMKVLGEVTCFAMYAGVGAISFLFILLSVAETKSRTPSEIRNALRDPSLRNPCAATGAAEREQEEKYSGNENGGGEK